jgi:RHS repeat-associated protein
LDYLNARYYDSNRGQFVSQDPIFQQLGNQGIEKLGNRRLQLILADPQSLNPYSYADNPLTIKDPSGLMSSNTAAILGLYAQLINLLSRIVVQLGGGGSAGNPVPASTAMLAHSTTINPGPLNITPSNQGNYGNLINKIQNSDIFSTYVQDQIDKNGKKGKLDVPSNDPNYSLNFTSGDLHTSLGKVNVGLSGAQSSNGSWNIKVNVSDTYDFSLVQDYGNGGSARGLTTLNNAAYVAQQAGVISDYPVDINFNYNYSPK